VHAYAGPVADDPLDLVVSSVRIRYGATVAVHDASFRARRGEVTAVVGPNGAGKTSTIEACEGFHSVDAGSISVLGLDPRRDRARLAPRTGVMLQQGGIYPTARVGETVRLFCALHGSVVDPDDLLGRLGLASLASRPWRRLSGGEQQRLSLALALAARPEVAFLDEPTNALDLDARAVVRTVVRELASSGAIVVVATHELAEAERFADSVVVFDGGRTIGQFGMEDVRRGDGVRVRLDRPVDRSRLLDVVGDVVDEGDGWWRVPARSDVGPVVAALQPLAAAGEAAILDVTASTGGLESYVQRVLGRG